MDKDAEKDSVDNVNIDDDLHPYVENVSRSHVRDFDIKIKALINANYLCEYDENHYCFKRKKMDLNYTEVHHIISLFTQGLDKFKNINLDCIENLISLCSNCHNQFYYGKGDDNILKEIYNQRKEKYKKIEINIT